MGRIQVHKVKGHEALVDKARFVFNISTTKTIKVNDTRFAPSVRLNRKELRALERAGYVKGYRTFGGRKFTDSSPSMYYLYEWVGPTTKEGRPATKGMVEDESR